MQSVRSARACSSRSTATLSVASAQTVRVERDCGHEPLERALRDVDRGDDGTLLVGGRGREQPGMAGAEHQHVPAGPCERPRVRRGGVDVERGHRRAQRQVAGRRGRTPSAP